MLTRNNVLFYYGTYDLLTTAADIQSAVGVLTRFEILVIKPTLAPTSALMQELLVGYRTIKPSGKVFGYTQYTSAVSDVTDAITAWQTDYPGALAGFYIDNFGAASKADQNAMVAAVRALSSTMSVFINPAPASLISTLEDVPSISPDPVIGMSSTAQDYVVIEDFYFKNEDSATPTREGMESIVGRMLFVANTVNRLSAVAAPITLKLNFVAKVGGGTAINVTDADYTKILNIANQYNLTGLAVVPFDMGAAGGYFESKQLKVFAP